MALDARIPMMGQMQPIESPTTALMRALQIQGAMQGNKLAQMQMRAAEQQQAQQQAQAEAMRNALMNLPSPQGLAASNALSAGGGPTVANAQRMQPVDPRAQALYGLAQAAPEKFLPQYLEAAFPSPQTDEGVVLSPGQVLVGKGSGKPRYTAPDRPEKIDPNKPFMVVNGQVVPNPDYQQYAERVARAGAANVSYGAPITAMNPETGQPELLRPDNKGGMKFTGIKPADAEKPFTEGQAKAVAFASRMVAADKVLADLARKGTRFTAPGAMGNNAVGSAITALLPAEQQQLAQAKRDFVNALLRRESGAVIAAEEFANAERQYFPQIGDSREVIEQKARNRRVAIEGMKADVPTNRRGEIDKIANPGGSDNDPLGIRGR